MNYEEFEAAAEAAKGLSWVRLQTHGHALHFLRLRDRQAVDGRGGAGDPAADGGGAGMRGDLQHRVAAFLGRQAGSYTVRYGTVS